jgi:protocatechuate 3,4-dioxygenase beta subunit
MYNDDAIVGRVLGRREALVKLGGVAVAFLAACADRTGDSTAAPSAVSTPSGATPEGTSSPLAATAAAVARSLPACIVRPALTEGPYFVDEKLNRSDIRSEPSTGAVKEGTPLRLTLNAASLTSNACTPLASAMVDIWQCDALGVYSDAQDPGFNTRGQKFLRGYQVTDANGRVEFTTIYPGWYRGRAVHIHFKIRGTRANSQNYEFTSQFFFDESITDQAHSVPPYASAGRRMVLNEGDGIYRQGGSQLLLRPVKQGNKWVASFDIGLQA